VNLDAEVADANLSGKAEIGYFGDLFVRMHHRDSADHNPMLGHKHAKDHITFVTSGRVRVEWRRDDGTSGAKVFVAPTFFIQDKDSMHTVIALEPGSTWWCVFAFSETEVGHDPIVAAENNPYV
jgi:hypothetical protein